MSSILEEEKQLDHLWLVKRSYWVGFFGSIGIVVLALAVAWLINRFYPLESMTIGLLQAFSFVPGSTVLFGVNDWDIRTWGGNTPPELLNRKLFKRISLIGLFFPIMAYALNPIEDKNPHREAVHSVDKVD